MIRRILVSVVFVCWFSSAALTQDFAEQYSARAGFYAPRDGLNNGFVLGADASLDFSDLRVIVNLSGDFYIKQTFNVFHDPAPEIVKQQILLVPLALGIGYRLVGAESGGLVLTAGAGVGYYVDFYNLDYRDFQTVPQRTRSDSKTGGSFFSSVFMRLALGNFFVEPKRLFAKSHEDAIGPYSYEINPAGFLVTVGFQY